MLPGAWIRLSYLVSEVEKLEHFLRLKAKSQEADKVVLSANVE